jgi:ABC-type dipeptide/oligopeptide/nickel transport system permease component/ABC-type transport system substrate-binding protein
VLTELVSEGKLPPLAERITSEPLVLAGVDGIGRYGGNWIDAVTWDSQVWDRMNRYNAGVSLVRWSPNGYPIVPHVAKSWDSSPDHRSWTFHLRPGMKWSDGHPFTADDFVYWFEWEVLYFQQLGYPLHDDSFRLLRSGDGYGRIEAVDLETVRFDFPHPNPFFLELVAGTSVKEFFAPRHYLEPYHPELGDRDRIREIMNRRGLSEPRQVYLDIKEEDNPEHPRLSPWIYRRYQSHAPHAFVRNPYYWAVDTNGNQLPYIDQITVEVLTPELLALKASSGGYPAIFETEDLDLANYGLYMSGREAGGYEVRHYTSGQSSLWSLSPNQDLHFEPDDSVGQQKWALLNQSRFRQALSLAINREAIIRAEFYGFGEPAQIVPSPASPFHSPRLYHAFTQYDPDRAGELLDSLGLTQRDRDGYRTLPDGSPLAFFIPYQENTSTGPLQFVIDDWAAVGVRARVRHASGGLVYALRMSATYDFFAVGSYVDFIPVVDPKSFVPVDRFAAYAPKVGAWYDAKLRAGYGDAQEKIDPPAPDSPFREVFDLYEQAMTASSREKGIELFKQIFDRAADQLWTISIASSPPAIAVVRDDFKNVPVSGLRGNVFHTPLNLGVETFYFEEPDRVALDSARLKSELTHSGASPYLESIDQAGPDGQGGRVAGLLKWSLGLVLVAGAVLVGFRHPYVGRRLLLFFPMLLVISIMAFIIIQIPPGNIVETRLLALEQSGTTVSQQEVERIKSTFHLDEPVVTRYLRWIGVYWFFGFSVEDRGLLQGDLGVAMIDPRRPQSVNRLVGDRLLFTIVLSLGTILFTWSLALPIGIYSAVRQYSFADYTLTFIGFIGMSVPGFLLSLLLMYWGGRFLGLDLTGLFSPEFETQETWTWGKVADLLGHIWVPLVVLGVEGTATMIRIMRGNLLDELRKPYVTTALAKGVRPFRLVVKYPVRVAINPFVSSAGSLFPELISGGAIVSVVLGLPTIGPLMLSAFLNEDVYLAGSMLVVLSLLGIVGTLVSDLLLVWLDPRIRLTGVTR